MQNTYDQISAVLQTMVKLLNADDYPALAHYYDFPFMMEMEDTAVLFVTPNEAMAAWHRFRSVMRQLGVHSSDIRVIAVELPRMGRQRVWIEFMHFDVHGKKLRSADLTMYFRVRPGKDDTGNAAYHASKHLSLLGLSDETGAKLLWVTGRGRWDSAEQRGSDAKA